MYTTVKTPDLTPLAATAANFSALKHWFDVNGLTQTLAPNDTISDAVGDVSSALQSAVFTVSGNTFQSGSASTTIAGTFAAPGDKDFLLFCVGVPDTGLRHFKVGADTADRRVMAAIGNAHKIVKTQTSAEHAFADASGTVALGTTSCMMVTRKGNATRKICANSAAIFTGDGTATGDISGDFGALPTGAGFLFATGCPWYSGAFMVFENGLPPENVLRDAALWMAANPSSGPYPPLSNYS